MVDTTRSLKMTDGSAVPAKITDPATSWAAALSINIPDLEAVVLKAVYESGDKGLMGEEISFNTGLAIQTCTPRVKPLLRKGLLVDTGYVRPAVMSNRKQRVVVAAEFEEAFHKRIADELQEDDT